MTASAMNIADGIILPDGMTKADYDALSADEKLNLVWLQEYSNGKLIEYRGQEARDKIRNG